MINSNGKVVWYQQSDTLLPIEFAPYAHSYLSSMRQSPREQLHEITYEGDTLLNLSFGKKRVRPAFAPMRIIKDDNNDILASTHEVINIDLSRVAGKQNDTLKTNG